MNAQVVQLLVSLAEVAAMVAVCAVLFGWRDAPIGGDALVAAFAKDVPGFHLGTVVLSADSNAALIEDVAGGRIYLAVARGDGVVTRKIGADLVAAVARDGRRLHVRLNDFTLRNLDIVLADAGAAAVWEERLRRAA